ncbi:MAG: hypothetical protein QW407_04680 [Thermofilaceae archaeon]
MVNVRVLSGKGHVGGNFIRVEDGDRVLIFDQGIRFDVLARYYGGFIAPRSLHELREVGAIPKAEWYAGASAVYISHMHLDHLGLLANIPAKVKVYIPSLSVYEILEEKWRDSPTWLSMVPRKYYVELEEVRSLEADENNVMPLPVSHSAYPAYAFLYFGSDETVLYTGDFRVEGFHSDELWDHPLMLDYLKENRDIRVDRLVIEGTNLGAHRSPISPAEEESMFKRILSEHSLVVTTMHPLDAEYALFVATLARDYNRPLYIASDEIAKLVELTDLPTDAMILDKYVKAMSRLERAEVADIGDSALIIAPYSRIVDLLRDLRAEGNLPPNAAVTLSEPEPQVEEAQEYGALMNWFAKLGVQSYAMRVSGHYYPYQLNKIVRILKPKEIELVHSTRTSISHA